MKINDNLRKIMTFAADALSVVFGSVLCTVLYHPEASVTENFLSIRAFLLMVLITMGLFSLILRTYNDPIFENFSLSVLFSSGTFLVALALALVFHLLVYGQSFDVIYLINILVYSIFFLGTYRLALLFLRRAFNVISNFRRSSTMQRVIIMGAGDAGKYLADLLRNDKSKNMYPVAFIDDNPAKAGKIFKGLRVVGGRALIPYAAEKYKADTIIIAIPFVDNSTIRDIFRLCSEASFNVKRFGNMTTFTADGLSKATINEIHVEDLLGRDVVKLDLESVSAYVTGKTVLVSGGAGSIGFELVNQILNYNARLVVIFDINENKLFEADVELRKKYPKTQFVTAIGSIQDRTRLREVFDLYKPSIVFHAAAHKHVPMMELNPQEALKNNVMGTLYMVEMAIKHQVDKFILISTDKAVNPTNIMGATKRVAEMLIQRANSWGTTRFSAVRFGNVLGSNGSVVPLFKKQISEGGPVTVTDKNIKRYFMTIPEAVQLVLETGALAKGGEIFVLDMGEPVSIYELAKSMIRLSGLKPDIDIKIEFTGLRPGEKLFEELSLSDEIVSKTENQRIYILKANGSPPIIFEAEFDKLCQSIDNRDFGSAIKKVGILVPTFKKQDVTAVRG
ncbi:nucleoside-diphosphate sugar epimerase/dehydratase [Oscillospiraceae bacterium WX1]